MKVFVILGTRPEAIKLSPVIIELQRRSSIDTTVCVTGQHETLVDQVISFFNIKVNYNLNIMKKNQSLFDITTRSLDGLNKIISSDNPDWIIVQGDTTATFVSALAAFYRKVKVAYIEAGLRTRNKFSPFPEEINRVLTSHLADQHFAPTQGAKVNLIKEGISKERIHVVGNPVIDALVMTQNKIQSNGLEQKYQARFNQVDFNKKIILVTGHRRESFGTPFVNICNALKQVASSHDVEIVYPVHLNPNVRKPVYDTIGDLHNIHLLEPVEYPAMVWLAQKSHFILTDSGGIQEEAPAIGKPVIVMREITERTESIDAGLSILAGTSKETIFNAVSNLLGNKRQYKSMARKKNIYGDGNASRRIVDILLKSNSIKAL